MITVRGLRRVYPLGIRRVEVRSKSGTEVMALLTELNRDGRTVIVVTHDENVAARCGRRVRVNDGLIVGDESREVAVG